MERKCSSVLKDSIDNLSKVVRNLEALISPVMSAAYEHQKGFETNILINVESSKHRIWQLQICVNASTAGLHTETDCIYTVTAVPNQYTKKLPKKRKHNLFLLHLNAQNIYSVPMIPQRYFIFSSLFITHRQHSGGFDANNIDFF